MSELSEFELKYTVCPRVQLQVHLSAAVSADTGLLLFRNTIKAKRIPAGT